MSDKHETAADNLIKRLRTISPRRSPGDAMVAMADAADCIIRQMRALTEIRKKATEAINDVG